MPPSGGIQYTVVKGDSLWRIAERVYGDGQLWWLIAKANPDKVADGGNLILIGVTLGFAARVVFASVEFAGELVGLQMGLNFAGFFDPATASQGTARAAAWRSVHRRKGSLPCLDQRGHSPAPAATPRRTSAIWNRTASISPPGR